jgi:DNA-binding GntR family transcriptional regulator
VTLAEEVRQKIASDILSGRLKPGQQLEENVLAAQFNVSRTPVRDALRELGGTGLVEVRPHRGVRVADIDVGLLEELFEAQTEVEAVCAQLTALRSNATDRRQLQLIQADAEKAVHAKDADAFDELDAKLHELIYGGTRNAILMDTARSLQRRAAPFRVQVIRQQHELLQASCSEHAAVVAAIAKSDGNAAHEAMREHLTNTSVQVIQYFRDEHGAS